MPQLKSTLIVTLAIILLMGCEPLTTETKDLGGTWQFALDSSNTGEDLGWFKPGWDRSDWGTMAVPQPWEFDDYDGFSWYARNISYGDLGGGYKLALVFEGVDDNATVWLDGELLGHHYGWDQLFFFDVTEYLSKGEEALLVVRIEDLGGPGGIHKPVLLKPYLEPKDLLASELSLLTAPEAPEWVTNAAIYELFVRSHSRPRSFNAVNRDLDRIKELGIDIIWLMPVHPVGVENRKANPGSPYAVRDYYQVNPRHGSVEDFKSLVDSVHARGMYIILDMVLNHSAWDNPLMDEHPEWYTKNDSGEFTQPFSTDWWDTADLNYDSLALRQWMMEMLGWWLSEMDVDGFRFDVAELVPYDFWKDAKEYCQSIKPDVFFLAEGARPELYMNGHDMTYSWNIWELVIQNAQGLAPVSLLKQSFEMEQYQYPKNALRMRFTENHDKPRSLGSIDDEQLNLTAWAFIALMKGNPLIYAGQEIGARERVDIHTDDRIDWTGADRELQYAMGQILKLRKARIQPDSNFEIVMADDAKQVIGYKHGSILAFFNFSDADFEFKAEGVNEVLLGGITREGSGRFILPAKEFGVFE